MICTWIRDYPCHFSLPIRIDFSEKAKLSLPSWSGRESSFPYIVDRRTPERRRKNETRTMNGKEALKTRRYIRRYSVTKSPKFASIFRGFLETWRTDWKTDKAPYGVAFCNIKRGENETFITVAILNSLAISLSPKMKTNSSKSKQVFLRIRNHCRPLPPKRLFSVSEKWTKIS